MNMAAWTLVLLHTCFIKYSNKLCDAKNFIPTLIYTWHLVADGTHQTFTQSAFTFKYLSHHGPRLLSQYIRSWFEISVARMLQLASHQCLLQITCQPGVSQRVQIDWNHWAWDQCCRQSGLHLPAISTHKPSWNCGVQQLPSLWTPSETPGW
jgi:hypothetical protein